MIAVTLPVAAWSALFCALAGAAANAGAAAVEAPHPTLVEVPAGPFIAGSDAVERELGYRLDEAAYGHGWTRAFGWYDRERPRGVHALDRFFMTKTPITNADYAAFVDDTGHRAPDVDAGTWRSYRLVHPYARTRRHAWRDDGPPPGREAHPVVLVSHGRYQGLCGVAHGPDRAGMAPAHGARVGEGGARDGRPNLSLG